MPAIGHAFINFYKREGVLAFYRGLTPNLIGVFPSRAVYFGSYNVAKKIFLGIGLPDGTFTHLASAMAAGISVSTATSPIWFVKTRMQLQTSQPNGQTKYKNSLDCVIKVYQEEGLRGFYRGLGASYLGIAESTIQFVAYEKVKSIVFRWKREYGGEQFPSIGVVEYLAVAGVAKTFATYVTYPHDVLRTRMREQHTQHKYTGLYQAFCLIVKEEGVRGLFSGVTIHLSRVVPNAAVMFWVYEGLVAGLNAR